MRSMLEQVVLCSALIFVWVGQAAATEQSIVNTTKSNTKDLVKEDVPADGGTPVDTSQQQIIKSKSNVKNNKTIPANAPEDTKAAKGINEAGIK